MKMTKSTIKHSLWTSVSSAPHQYPWLAHDCSCQVAVVGGGLAGAFAAYIFAKAGLKTVLVSRSPIGYGETAGGMGILEYDHDEGLLSLAKKIGKEKAVQAFSLCRQALDRIEEICGGLKEDVGFVRRDCLVCTEDKQEADRFYDEYRMRRHNGFDVQMLTRETAGELFSFPLEAGILSKGLGGEVDPYRLCCALVRAAKEAGAQVYENTGILSIAPARGKMLLQSDYGKSIRADKVVLATGVEQDSYLNALSARRTAFCVATEPVSSFAGYQSRCIIRDNRAPYTRVRSTGDGRILIGGLDSSLIGADGKIGGLLKAKKWWMCAIRSWNTLWRRCSAPSRIFVPSTLFPAPRPPLGTGFPSSENTATIQAFCSICAAGEAVFCTRRWAPRCCSNRFRGRTARSFSCFPLTGTRCKKNRSLRLAFLSIAGYNKKGIPQKEGECPFAERPQKRSLAFKRMWKTICRKTDGFKKGKRCSINTGN